MLTSNKVAHSGHRVLSQEGSEDFVDLSSNSLNVYGNQNDLTF